MTDNEPGLDSQTSTTGDPARNALAAAWPIGRKVITRNRTEMNVMNTSQGHRKLISDCYPQRPLLALCLIDTTNFTLTARFSNGTESPHSAPFAFTKPSGTVDPLQAAVTGNPTNGTAPLAVTLNGLASTGNLSSYQWDFGDGSTGTGATPSHTYTTAGSHTAKLTFSNASNQTSVATTVVTVTAPINTTPPTAVFSASTTGGVAPLAVTFNGSGSTAASGNFIASYAWSFGDGSTASGSTASHSFTTAGTYTTALTVTDNKGANNTNSTNITVEDEPQAIALNIKVVEVSVTHNWVRVPITSTFENPIVIAGPPGYIEVEPIVVRLRNVSKTGFEIMVDEWNYLDGGHMAESVRYLVIEKGRTTLPDGSIVEAGSFTGSTRFKTVVASHIKWFCFI